MLTLTFKENDMATLKTRATGKASDWQVQIFVPQDGQSASLALRDDPVQKQSKLLPSSWFGGGKVETVDGTAMQTQWKETIDNMLGLTTSIVGSAGAWQLDSMEIGMTLSAKGKLLFIAEAGAQASVKLTLKRKP
jgi:hypothetical protein